MSSHLIGLVEVPNVQSLQDFGKNPIRGNLRNLRQNKPARLSAWSRRSNGMTGLVSTRSS